MLAGITFLSAAFAQAQTETTIYDFGTTAPNIPYSGVVSDAAGNLYGVAPLGSSGNHGVVYELSLVNGAWQATVLYNFTGGADGATPYATPVFDAAGNLYGTASGGGAHGYGVVFKLSPSASGWKQSVLYSFTGGNDGMVPTLGNLVIDKGGNIYGSNVAGANLTSEACQNTGGCGVIFELSPVARGQYKFDLVHTFSGGWDGVGPAFLTFDSKGTLYGSAAGAWGGWESPNAPGLIFKLTPTTSGPWKDSAIYAFTGSTDGGLPSAVVFDKAGNMYGTGGDGGILNNCWSGYGPMGCGVVFKLTPEANGKWKETAIYAFTGGSDGSQPDAGLVIDKGILYGTTWGGGTSNGGVVFQLSPNPGGGWTEYRYTLFRGHRRLYPALHSHRGSRGKPFRNNLLRRNQWFWCSFRNHPVGHSAAIKILARSSSMEGGQAFRLEGFL
jgi:uncharacterized repeat protein (TIGR03803 family)